MATVCYGTIVSEDAPSALVIPEDSPLVVAAPRVLAVKGSVAFTPPETGIAGLGQTGPPRPDIRDTVNARRLFRHLLPGETWAAEWLLIDN